MLFWPLVCYTPESPSQDWWGLFWPDSFLLTGRSPVPCVPRQQMVVGGTGLVTRILAWPGEPEEVESISDFELQSQCIT